MKQKVLIVDDEKFFGEAIKLLLVRNGFEAEYAENTNEVFSNLSEKKFDVALIDIYMPDINGIDLAMIIMQKQPMIPIILMTGKGTVEDFLIAQSKGIDDFIQKPFETAMLVRMIKEIGKNGTVSEMV